MPCARFGAGDAAVAVVVVQDQSITLCLRACFLRTPAPPAARPETRGLPVPKGSKTALRTLPVRSDFAGAALFPTFGRFGPDRCHFGLNWAKRPRRSPAEPLSAPIDRQDENLELHPGAGKDNRTDVRPRTATGRQPQIASESVQARTPHQISRRSARSHVNRPESAAVPESDRPKPPGSGAARTGIGAAGRRPRGTGRGRRSPGPDHARRPRSPSPPRSAAPSGSGRGPVRPSSSFLHPFCAPAARTGADRKRQDPIGRRIAEWPTPAPVSAGAPQCASIAP